MIIPKITVMIPVTDNQDALINELDLGNFQWKLIADRSVIHVTLPPRARADSFSIPEPGEGLPLFLEVMESGGRKGNSGHAIIICDIEGKPLRPFKITTKIGDNNHAFFAGQKSIVVVQARYSNAKLDITGFDATPDNTIAWLDRTNVLGQDQARDFVQWRCTGCSKIFMSQRPLEEHRTPKGASCEGEVYPILELPGVYSHFQEAIQAALKKAACQRCRHVHYAILGNSQDAVNG